MNKITIRKGLPNLLILSFSVLSYVSSFGQSQIKIDDYKLLIHPKFELLDDQYDENILIILNDPKGNTVIIQNKVNVLKTVLYEKLNDEEILSSMHNLKFNNFVKMLKGYDVSDVAVEKIGEIPFSIQTFKYLEEGVELVYDLRIVQIENNYYPFYSFDKSENLRENKEVVNMIIRSLSKENFRK